MQYEKPFVAISGVDQCGKTLQSRLLSWVLAPTLWLHFPDYHHWSGQIIDSILHSKSFNLYQDPNGFSQTFAENKDPYVFQMLQAISRQHRKAEMVTALAEGRSVVCDRFSVEGICYGLADGCKLEWLAQMENLYLKPDVTIILHENRRFRRTDGVPDLNERCDDYQAKVRELYLAVQQLWPERFTSLYFDPLPEGDYNRVLYAWDRHVKIVQAMNLRLGTEYLPLNPENMRGLMEETGCPPGELPANSMDIRIPQLGETR